MSLGLVRDVLNAKPFQYADMTNAANDVVPWKPGQVGALNIFQPEPLFTDVAYISERAGKLALIPTSKRGGPSAQVTPDKQTMRTCQTFRLSEEDQINASEIFNVAAFQQPNAMENLATVRNKRLEIMADNMDFTFEHLLLNALKGDVKDADGSTSITNLFTLFNVVQEAEIAFDLGNTTLGTLYTKLGTVARTIYNHLEADAARVNHFHVLCSQSFFEDLLVNKDVLTWAQIPPNSDYLKQARVFGILQWHGWIFEEYRLGTIAGAAGGSWIDTDKCIVFPVGPSIYTTFFSPGEHFGALDGSPARPRYARAAADQEWDEFIKLKLQSYPLPICTRPKVLMKGKKGS